MLAEGPPSLGARIGSVGSEPPKMVGGGWFGVSKPAHGDGDQKQDPPTCSFCGREGRRGVMGGAAFICFDCIDLAAEIKSESLGDRK